MDWREGLRAAVLSALEQAHKEGKSMDYAIAAGVRARAKGQPGIAATAQAVRRLLQAAPYRFPNWNVHA